MKCVVHKGADLTVVDLNVGDCSQAIYTEFSFQFLLDSFNLNIN